MFVVLINCHCYECHFAEWYSDECHFTECHSDDCHSTECLFLDSLLYILRVAQVTVQYSLSFFEMSSNWVSFFWMSFCFMSFRWMTFYQFSDFHDGITTACIRHQYRKTTVLTCNICLINTGVEKNVQHSNIDYNFDHQMSLSKSKCWYSNNCLYFLKRAVPLFFC